MNHGRKEQQDGNEGKETGSQENEGTEENKGNHKEEVTRQMGMEEQTPQGQRQQGG